MNEILFDLNPLLLEMRLYMVMKIVLIGMNW